MARKYTAVAVDHVPTITELKDIFNAAMRTGTPEFAMVRIETPDNTSAHWVVKMYWEGWG